MAHPYEQYRPEDFDLALRNIGRGYDGKVFLAWLQKRIDACFEKAMQNAVTSPQTALTAITDAAKLREVIKAVEKAAE